MTLAQGERLEVQFAGGEPTLHMALVERVSRRVVGEGVTLQLQTNATLVDGEVARSLKALDIAVGVSLDGPPEVNDGLRPTADGCGSTANALAGIACLREADVAVGMTCVVTAANVGQLPLLVEIAAYLGNVRGISLDPLRPLGRGSSGSVAPARPADAYYWTLEALRRADRVVALGGPLVQFRELERSRHALVHGIARDSHCYFDTGQSLAVTPDGDCFPCASLAGLAEFRLGSIMEDSFAAAFPYRIRQARGLVEQPVRCTECDDRLICGGGCPANLYAHGALGQMTECAIKCACIAHLRQCSTRGR